MTFRPGCRAAIPSPRVPADATVALVHDLVTRGLSTPQLAARSGVPYGTIRHWLRAENHRTVSASSARAIRELHDEFRRGFVPPPAVPAARTLGRVRDLIARGFTVPQIATMSGIARRTLLGWLGSKPPQTIRTDLARTIRDLHFGLDGVTPAEALVDSETLDMALAGYKLVGLTRPRRTAIQRRAVVILTARGMSAPAIADRLHISKRNVTRMRSLARQQHAHPVEDYPPSANSPARSTAA
jgi:transposase